MPVHVCVCGMIQCLYVCVWHDTMPVRACVWHNTMPVRVCVCVWHNTMPERVSVWHYTMPVRVCVWHLFLELHTADMFRVPTSISAPMGGVWGYGAHQVPCPCLVLGA